MHAGKRLRVFFQDEARFGQKGRLCHRWWLKGQRPPGLCDQRFDWTYLFAAVEPGSIRNFVLGGADFIFRRSSPLRTARRR